MTIEEVTEVKILFCNFYHEIYIRLTNYKNKIVFSCTLIELKFCYSNCLCIWPLVCNDGGGAEIQLLKIIFNLYILIHVRLSRQVIIWVYYTILQYWNIEKTSVTREFFIIHQKHRLTSIQHITYLQMTGKFSFLKLLNHILKESEIQEEAKAD